MKRKTRKRKTERKTTTNNCFLSTSPNDLHLKLPSSVPHKLFSQGCFAIHVKDTAAGVNEQVISEKKNCHEFGFKSTPDD